MTDVRESEPDAEGREASGRPGQAAVLAAPLAVGGPSNGRPPVILFLPAHDEEATVGSVVSRAPAEVCGHPVQVIVIDDGSQDRTVAVAEAAGAAVHSFTTNRGLGAAVRQGLALAGDRQPVAVAFCDADGEYAPEELERLVAPVVGGQADYVIGSRFAGLPRAMRPHRWLGNRLLTEVLALLVRRWGVRHLSDAQSGYRALSPEAARQAEIIHDFNYAQVLTLDLLAKGFRYAEVPITYRFRRHGRSFVRLLPYLRQVIPAVRHELRSGDARLPTGKPAPSSVGDHGTPSSHAG